MKRFLTFLLVLGLLISYSATALAAPSASADYNEEAEARKSFRFRPMKLPTGQPVRILVQRQLIC